MTAQNVLDLLEKAEKNLARDRRTFEALQTDFNQGKEERCKVGQELVRCFSV